MWQRFRSVCRWLGLKMGVKPVVLHGRCSIRRGKGKFFVSGHAMWWASEEDHYAELSRVYRRLCQVARHRGYTMRLNTPIRKFW